MNNFTPLKIPGSKKRNFNKFLIIGNLFLIVFVAFVGFFYYNKTLIQTKPQAVGPGACNCSDSHGNPSPGSCLLNGSCDCGGLKERGNRCTEKAKGGADNQQNGNSCANSGGTWCDLVVDYNTKQKVPGFCLARGSNITCGNAAADKGYVIKIGSGCPAGTVCDGTGWICKIGQKNYTGGPCIQGNSVSSYSGAPPACFCGVIQIDGGTNDGTYKSSCGCNNDVIPSATPVISNTPTPTPTTELTITPTPTEIVTETPTPTTTPIISNTPTVTPTETIIPSLTPTDTPTATPTETPGPTVTDTPGPSATPTEIIVAQISASPTTTVQLLQTGVIKSVLYWIPTIIILVGLIL